MHELSSPPSVYSSKDGGIIAGRDVVRLFPGAEAVLKKLTDSTFSKVQIAVASSTRDAQLISFGFNAFALISCCKEPAFAHKCLDTLPLGGTFATVGELVRFRKIFRGSFLVGLAK